MGKSLKQFWTPLFLALLLLASVAVSEANDVIPDMIQDFEDMIDYDEYLEQYQEQGALQPQWEILVQAEEFTSTDMPIELLPLAGADGLAVATIEQGYIEWEVEVPEAGLYNIGLRYYPIKGRGTSIERAIEINGLRPFEGAGYLSFSRIWGDAEPIRMDNQGNELRPLQREYPMWREQVLQDSMGDYLEPYKFYFDAGKNTITLRSRRESVAIDYLRLFQVQESPAYADLLDEYGRKDYKPASGVFIKLQERDSTYRSEPTIAPQFDQGDPTMEPYHEALIRLNSLGGDSWKYPGQWVSWDFDIPEDGLYQIAIKAKQNLRRGSFCNRRIFIDGKLPFQELQAIRFPYSSGYQMKVLGPEDEDEPYLFYLTKGRHSITMEVVLGDLVTVIRTIQNSLYDLNSLYRKVVMITSPTPDPMRTYELPKRIPGLLEGLLEHADVLSHVAGELEAYTSQKGGTTVLLQDLTRQLRDMADNPDTIPTRLGEFRDNLGSLGTWLLVVREQPVQIDYLIIASPEQTLPEATAMAGERMRHEIRALSASYTHNYQLVGDVYDRDDEVEPLKVWLGWGRDQAQILKRLIENSFTPYSGIPVNLELVSMGVLLPATLAGRGPDVAMGVPTAQPINFAFRGGVVDLSGLPGFDEVAARFKHSALVPYMFRESIYAVPDQQPFLMMFYRRDVLHELELEVPNTWDDVLDIIPVLQKRNMQFGLPFSVPAKSVSGAIGDVSQTLGSVSSSGGVLNFLTFLYQRGEELFIEDGVATNLDHEIAIEAFTRWTELHELYKLPLDYDPANRFRMGEMPLVITDYTFYNRLQVFAPELRGKWDFTLLPGTPRSDGSIDRSAPVSVQTGPMSGQSGSIILSASDQVDAAWEFLRWWTSAETQIEFGRQIESLMGPAARYATANVEALTGLPWSVDEHNKLMAQWQWVKGVPEVPGGYMIGRYLDNAFRQVVYNTEPARDTLLDYDRMINEELARKRKEFGLPTSVDELEKEWRKLYWVAD